MSAHLILELDSTDANTPEQGHQSAQTGVWAAIVWYSVLFVLSPFIHVFDCELIDVITLLSMQTINIEIVVCFRTIVGG